MKTYAVAVLWKPSSITNAAETLSAFVVRASDIGGALLEGSIMADAEANKQAANKGDGANVIRQAAAVVKPAKRAKRAPKAAEVITGPVIQAANEACDRFTPYRPNPARCEVCGLPSDRHAVKVP